MSHLQTDKKTIIEGELRCELLKNHLVNSQLKISPNAQPDMSVFLSEDGSGTVKRITFDPVTKQVIGIVLPLGENGMPQCMTFRPKSANDVEEIMKLDKSYLVYIMIAQSMCPNVPPFILHIFGTNNKFKKKDVLRRWEYVYSKHNVILLCIILCCAF